MAQSGFYAVMRAYLTGTARNGAESLRRTFRRDRFSGPLALRSLLPHSLYST